MLYNQIRHAGAVRTMYRMKHLLAQDNPPDMGSRLGYPKYSKQFYRVKALLRKEGVINRRGRFAETLPNLHVAEMPLRVDAAQRRALGSRAPYLLFLALALGGPERAGRLIDGLRLSRAAVYAALGRMERCGLVAASGLSASAVDGPAKRWVLDHIGIVADAMDVTSDTAPLFGAIPSYMGGPHARIATRYEPGRLGGPGDMAILTLRPFLGILRSVVGRSRYFARYPKRVSVGVADRWDVTWVDGMPYGGDAGG